MADTNSGSISMDDLFAALGSGSSAQTPTSGNNASTSAGGTDDTLAELFSLVGDSAVAAKRAERADAEPELDLFAALNIDTTPAAQRSSATTNQQARQARMSEREDQIREQQIRSQQWQRELEAREERLRRAEQARIEEAEAKIRREQEAAAAQASTAPAAQQQAAPAASAAVTEPVSPQAQVQSTQSAPAEQAAAQPDTAVTDQARREADAYAAEQARKAEAQAAEQARLEAEAAERAASAEREAAMKAKADAMAQQQAAQQQAAAQAQAQAAEVQARVEAQRAADETAAAAARAEAERKAQEAAALASQPTQAIKPLSESATASQPAEVAPAGVAQSAVSADTTAELSAIPAAAAEQAAPSAEATQVIEPAPSAEAAAPAAQPAQAQPAPAAGAWERKQEPVKRTEEKRDENRFKPTKRANELVKPADMAPVPVKAQGIQIPSEDEEYDESAVGGKLGNVIGIILIVIAVICIVLTILLFTGTINKDTFAVNNAPANEVIADEEVSNTENNNQATYSYAVRGLNGETHEAIEVATFGNDGKLSKSSIEITVPSQEVADALLAQLKEEFGDKIESSSATADKVNVVVLIEDSDLDKNGYTELLASTMTDFKEINQ